MIRESGRGFQHQRGVARAGSGDGRRRGEPGIRTRRVVARPDHGTEKRHGHLEDRAEETARRRSAIPRAVATVRPAATPASRPALKFRRQGGQVINCRARQVERTGRIAFIGCEGIAPSSFAFKTASRNAASASRPPATSIANSLLASDLLYLVPPPTCCPRRSCWLSLGRPPVPTQEGLNGLKEVPFHLTFQSLTSPLGQRRFPSGPPNGNTPKPTISFTTISTVSSPRRFPWRRSFTTASSPAI